MKKQIIWVMIVALLSGGNLVWAALDETKVAEVLTFTRDFLLKESKNSGIFSLARPDTGELQWFELYGILSQVKEEKDSYVVTVDVDMFGYNDSNYLLYFIVKDVNGQYRMDEIKIGPRFVRKDSQKNSFPE